MSAKRALVKSVLFDFCDNMPRGVATELKCGGLK